ncbi:hypothetical protein LXM50_10235 [Microbacterium sp. Au-Mic1]|uniref:hypothetical protein n=1 Tax=Microbacterium sp. Au-Mic1 TaxID=2906457 RepID=UPI001E4110A6|nr:hypothetical protein [Microbacterium sp. Au-Mic1]MCE4026347.1 hypothetical protein [Microbacterium sp. Au-Mic1]
MSWADVAVFGEPMIDLRGDPRRAAMLTEELRREIARKHPLAGVRWTVVAEAEPQDDVLAVARDRVVLVHLTWSGKKESPPWPHTVTIPDHEALLQIVANRY